MQPHDTGTGKNAAPLHWGRTAHSTPEEDAPEEDGPDAESSYHLLADTMPQIVWSTRPDGGHDYFNRQWYEYTGMTFAETREWGWARPLHPDDTARSIARWQHSVHTGAPYEIEYRLRRGSDGAYRWFLGRALPVRNGEGAITRWFGTCTDIEDQKRTEKAQRFLADLGGRIRPFGDPEEVLWSIMTAVGDHLQTARCGFVQVYEETGMVDIRRDYCRNGARSVTGAFPMLAFGAEVLAIVRAGQTLVIDDTRTNPNTAAYDATSYSAIDVRALLAVPLLNNGVLVAMFAVSMADTPRPWRPDEIELFEEIAARAWLALENARLFRNERERNEQLSQAIQEAHHRIKNNLQAVTALIEIQLGERGEEVSAEVIADSLRQIKTIAIVHDMLARDKPMGEVDAASVLARLVELLRTALSNAARQCPISLQAEPIVLATKVTTSLALIVNELVSNAAKHSCALAAPKSGRAAASANSSSSAISVVLEQRGDTIRLVVEDPGPGFPPNFDAEASAHIGLELVQSLAVNDLQGTVTFSSVESRNEPEADDVAGSCTKNHRRGRVEICFPAAAPDA